MSLSVGAPWAVAGGGRVAGRAGHAGVGMSPDWAGWLVLHAAIVTLFIAGAAILAVVTLQTVARWLLRRWWGRP